MTNRQDHDDHNCHPEKNGMNVEGEEQGGYRATAAGCGGDMKPTTTIKRNTIYKRMEEGDMPRSERTKEISFDLLSKIDSLLHEFHGFVTHLGVAYVVGMGIMAFGLSSELAVLYTVYVLLVLPIIFVSVIQAPFRTLIGDWEPLRDVVRYLRQNFLLSGGGGWRILFSRDLAANIQDDLLELRDTILGGCSPRQSTLDMNGEVEDESRCSLLEADSSLGTNSDMPDGLQI